MMENDSETSVLYNKWNDIWLILIFWKGVVGVFFNFIAENGRKVESLDEKPLVIQWLLLSG